jgi:hypothetical protein
MNMGSATIVLSLGRIDGVRQGSIARSVHRGYLIKLLLRGKLVSYNTIEDFTSHCSEISSAEEQ